MARPEIIVAESAGQGRKRTAMAANSSGDRESSSSFVSCGLLRQMRL
jgi:hypothetical protein